MRFVVIPSNYEQLPDTCRKRIVPIYIASEDRHGNRISQVWFDCGVAPVQNLLRSLARFRLGDEWQVSELAEITVHKLWKRHQDDAGMRPWRRVLVRATWEAEDLRVGGWHARKYRHLYSRLDFLDQQSRAAIADPNGYDKVWERRLTLDELQRRLRHEDSIQLHQVYNLLLSGYSWEAIAEQLGEADGEPIRKKFSRWLKRMADGRDV